tara:strand:+ start:720 stop:1181 length:462 start_codon:yes stop_codon:yes gene_type:complete
MVERLDNELILSLGSNLGNRKQNLKNCTLLINNQIGQVQRESNVFENPAQDFESENDFLNTCIKVKTELKAFEILRQIQDIEKKMGRIRKTNSYEDRIIDIDIILLNNEVLETTKLTIPHKKYRERIFVLKPLFELGNYLDPQLFLTTEELLR